MFANTRLRAIRKSRMIALHDARQVRPRQGCGQPREAPLPLAFGDRIFEDDNDLIIPSIREIDSEERLSNCDPLVK